jgi:hypothetical protein
VAYQIKGEIEEDYENSVGIIADIEDAASSLVDNNATPSMVIVESSKKLAVGCSSVHCFKMMITSSDILAAVHFGGQRICSNDVQSLYSPDSCSSLIPLHFAKASEHYLSIAQIASTFPSAPHFHE